MVSSCLFPLFSVYSASSLGLVHIPILKAVPEFCFLTLDAVWRRLCTNTHNRVSSCLFPLFLAHSASPLVLGHIPILKAVPEFRSLMLDAFWRRLGSNTHNRVSSCSSPLFLAHNSPFMSTYSCVESSPVISLSDVGRSLGCCSYQTWFKRDTECREIHLTSWWRLRTWQGHRGSTESESWTGQSHVCQFWVVLFRMLVYEHKRTRTTLLQEVAGKHDIITKPTSRVEPWPRKQY